MELRYDRLILFHSREDVGNDSAVGLGFGFNASSPMPFQPIQAFDQAMAQSCPSPRSQAYIDAFVRSQKSGETRQPPVALEGGFNPLANTDYVGCEVGES